jgi:NlpC/P60 family putative phage cell wall peptidase
LVGVWRELTGEAAGPLPPYTTDWAEALGRETLAEGIRARMVEIAPGAAREGDVVLFRWRAHLPAKHAAILTGPAMMVHAQQGATVAEVPLSPWWKRRVAFAFAFPDLS